MKEEINFALIKMKDFSAKYDIAYQSLANYNAGQEIKGKKQKFKIKNALRKYVSDLENIIYGKKALIKRFLNNHMNIILTIYSVFDGQKYLESVCDEIIFQLDKKAKEDFIRLFGEKWSDLEINGRDMEFSTIDEYYEEFGYKEVVDAHFQDLGK